MHPLIDLSVSCGNFLSVCDPVAGLSGRLCGCVVRLLTREMSSAFHAASCSTDVAGCKRAWRVVASRMLLLAIPCWACTCPISVLLDKPCSAVDHSCCKSTCKGALPACYVATANLCLHASRCVASLVTQTACRAPAQGLWAFARVSHCVSALPSQAWDGRRHLLCGLCW